MDMPDHEARGRAVYDHTDEDPRPSGRRRPAADWGVGEEIFDRLPARRFTRGDHPRGGADDGRRTIVIGEPSEAAPAEDHDEFATRDEALREHAARYALWGGDEPFVGQQGHESFGGDEPQRESSASAGHRPVARGGQPGRRTVKIGGRPGEHLSFDRPPRRRPPRTVGERVGPRPDRVAAWPFVLGLVLILIAVVSALAGG
jgi:hypothetical protein